MLKDSVEEEGMWLVENNMKVERQRNVITERGRESRRCILCSFRKRR